MARKKGGNPFGANGVRFEGCAAKSMATERTTSGTSFSAVETRATRPPACTPTTFTAVSVTSRACAPRNDPQGVARRGTKTWRYPTNAVANAALLTTEEIQ
jgi:hypothetical protein